MTEIRFFTYLCDLFTHKLFPLTIFHGSDYTSLYCATAIRTHTTHRIPKTQYYYICNSEMLCFIRFPEFAPKIILNLQNVLCILFHLHRNMLNNNLMGPPFLIPTIPCSGAFFPFIFWLHSCLKNFYSLLSFPFALNSCLFHFFIWFPFHAWNVYHSNAKLSFFCSLILFQNRPRLTLIWWLEIAGDSIGSFAYSLSLFT